MKLVDSIGEIRGTTEGFVVKVSILLWVISFGLHNLFTERMLFYVWPNYIAGMLLEVGSIIAELILIFVFMLAFIDLIGEYNVMNNTGLHAILAGLFAFMWWGEGYLMDLFPVGFTVSAAEGICRFLCLLASIAFFSMMIKDAIRYGARSS